jgi:IPT/TIG domain-containing protein
MHLIFASSHAHKHMISGLGVLVLLAVCGCGASSSVSSTQSSGSGGSGGSGGSAGNSFKPRPFPGDFFVRLSPQAGNGYAAAAAYDPALKEVFVSDPITNSVEVYSTVDAHQVGEISVPGPAGLSFSPDFSKLVIGTITPYVYTADPIALHITGQIDIPASYITMSQYQALNLPVMLYALSDGTIMIGLGTNPASSNGSYTIVAHLLLYNPGSATFTLEDPGNGAVTTVPARSEDGSSLLVLANNNSSPMLFVYKPSGHGYAISAPAALPSNLGVSLAANQDGSQFALIIGVTAPEMPTTLVNFVDGNLHAESQYTNTAATTSGVYSRDGSLFYLMFANNVLAGVNTQTGSAAGYLQESIASTVTYAALFDVDENFRLIGGSLFNGIFLMNASQLQSSVPTGVPDYFTPTEEGSATVGTLSGGQLDVFAASAAYLMQNTQNTPTLDAYFGIIPAQVETLTQGSNGSSPTYSLTATVPASSTPGPVSVVLTDVDNNVTFLPDDFTYGPRLLRISPTAVSSSGGDAVTVTGYGFSQIGDPEIGTLHIGNAALDLSQGVQTPASSNYFPEQSDTLPAPAGTPGWADVSVSNTFGSDTIKRGLQYLNAEAFVKGPEYSFAVYDPVRDRFYLTGSGNNVAVFDAQSQKFLAALSSQAISSSAALYGEALTPDSSKLLVSDPQDQIVVVFDLVGGTSASVEPLVTITPTITLTDPMPIVAASNNRAFVSLTPCIDDPVREIDLTDLSIQARPDAAGACGAYQLYPEFGGASADGNTILYAGNGNLFGEEPPGPEFVWSYNANTDTFTGPVQIGDYVWIGGQPAVDGDGQVLALSQGTLDQRLLPLAPLQVGGWDSRLNHTGSLLYSVFNSVVISDTHNGRPLLNLPLPAGTIGAGSSVSSYRPLAIDPTGQKILVATQTGVSYFELSVIPLAVGTVSPSAGSAGTSVQIRGSGFVSGTAAQIGGQNATCTETDSETLSCTIPNLPAGSAPMILSNPDGQTYAFENAFQVQ